MADTKPNYSTPSAIRSVKAIVGWTVAIVFIILFRPLTAIWIAFVWLWAALMVTLHVIGLLISALIKKILDVLY